MANVILSTPADEEMFQRKQSIINELRGIGISCKEKYCNCRVVAEGDADAPPWSHPCRNESCDYVNGRYYRKEIYNGLVIDGNLYVPYKLGTNSCMDCDLECKCIRVGSSAVARSFFAGACTFFGEGVVFKRKNVD